MVQRMQADSDRLGCFRYYFSNVLMYTQYVGYCVYQYLWTCRLPFRVQLRALRAGSPSLVRTRGCPLLAFF